MATRQAHESFDQEVVRRQQRRHVPVEEAPGPDVDASAQPLAPLPMLGTRRQAGRGGRSGDVAAILHLQQIQGNQAVGRMVRRGSLAPVSPATTLQRDEDEEPTVDDLNPDLAPDLAPNPYDPLLPNPYELPPPEPDQPGDYPSPLPSEEERYA